MDHRVKCFIEDFNDMPTDDFNNVLVTTIKKTKIKNRNKKHKNSLLDNSDDMSENAKNIKIKIVDDLLIGIYNELPKELSFNGVNKIQYHSTHNMHTNKGKFVIAFFNNNKIIYSICKPIKVDSHNRGEYVTLIIVLDICSKYDIKNCVIQGCNCLPINQVNRLWKVKNEELKIFYYRSKSYPIKDLKIELTDIEDINVIMKIIYLNLYKVRNCVH